MPNAAYEDASPLSLEQLGVLPGDDDLSFKCEGCNQVQDNCRGN